MRPLLQLVPPRDRELAERKAGALCVANRGWAGQMLGSKAANVCENLAFVIASTSPSMELARLSIWHRFCLWTVLVDDELDDPAAELPAVGSLGSEVIRTLHDVGQAAAGNVVCRRLREVLRGLWVYDRHGFWRPHVLDGLRLGIQTSVEHVRLSRQQGDLEAATVSAETYLDLASQSINHRAVALAMVLLTDDTPATPDDLRRLNSALDSACRAIRLANDLRSIERHRNEGMLNVLMLRTVDGNAMTPERARRDIAAHAAVYEGLVASISASDELREALSSSLRLAVGVYGLGDLR